MAVHVALVQLATITLSANAAAFTAAAAAIVSGLAGHRISQRRIGPEINNLKADAAQKIAQAAEHAIDLMAGTLARAEAALADGNTKLDTMGKALDQLERELSQTITERDEAVRDVRSRDRRIAELEDTLDRVRARLSQLEDRVSAQDGSGTESGQPKG